MLAARASRLALWIRTTVGRIDPVLLAAIIIGLAVRVWRLGSLPPGLNQDEASTAYDAFSLVNFGVDRHGFRFPVVLISWGSGMYALASYFEAPFIRLFGLSVLSARIPFFLAGLAALPLFFTLVRGLCDRRTARIGVLLLAVCPWHVMVSRWALDSNLFPFVFLVGTVLLQRSLARPRLLLGAAFTYALTLYSYGTAYVAVPAFMALMLVYGLRHRLWPMRTVVWSAVVFVVTATPVALYVAINSLGWRSIRTPFFSIPRLTGIPRYKTMGNFNLLSLEFFQQAAKNLGHAADLFRRQDDGLIWNAIPEYGILYWFSTLLVLVGLATLVGRNLRRGFEPTFPLLAWCLGAVVLAAFVEANINRINIAMFPFVACAALGASLLSRHRYVGILLAILVVGSFGGFVASYFGPYRSAAAPSFYASVGEAIVYATKQTDGEICITQSDVSHPYIFVLFYTKEDPRAFERTAVYENPGAEFEEVSSFGRYRFGLSRCADAAPVVVATRAEAEKMDSSRFVARPFERFTVLTRR